MLIIKNKNTYFMFGNRKICGKIPVAPVMLRNILLYAALSNGLAK